MPKTQATWLEASEVYVVKNKPVLAPVIMQTLDSCTLPSGSAEAILDKTELYFRCWKYLFNWKI